MAGSSSERLRSFRTAPRVEPMSSDEEQPTSVLIVDDNHDAADSTCYILSHMGYPAHVAYDAARAVQLARAHGPRAVPLDLAMPVANGLELAQYLRRLPEVD